ncbi:hypothetical protein KZ302_27435, partial [Escherichia coli]
IDLEVAAHYAAEDAHVTYRLYEVLAQKLKQSPELEQLLYQIEVPVARILAGMEEAGIKLDHDFLGRLSGEFTNTIQGLED